MISVTQAKEIIKALPYNFGVETINFTDSVQRILAQDIVADRPFPPFDRVSMDGIAIAYEQDTIEWNVVGLQAAGQKAFTLLAPNLALEIMTGAILPNGANTVIKYEELEITNQTVKYIGKNDILKGQNVHLTGTDVNQNTVLLPKGKKIEPSDLAILASVGATEIEVFKNPTIALISTGDELVEPKNQPETHQIRISNVYAIAAQLQKNGFSSTLFHLPDNEAIMHAKLQEIVATFDILILTGGVSMGKKDFLPSIMEQMEAKTLFHKIKQTPGKPFWLGKIGSKVIFGLPGNPVSSFMCTIRYVLPYLTQNFANNNTAILESDFSIKSNFTYFLQVNAQNINGQTIAKPINGNGSGDFANLIEVNGFLELNFETEQLFQKGTILPLWSF